MNHNTPSHRIIQSLFAFCFISIPLGLMLFFPLPTSAKPSSVYNVNNSGNGDDITPGNNICETGTGNGICTLRAAITEANNHAGADNIGFTMDMTIVLTDTLPAIAEDLSIGGPCTTCVAISGNNLYRVMVLYPSVSLYLADLTIANGNALAGGGIYNLGGTLNILNSIFSNNSGGGGNGGGIYNVGTLNVTNTTFYSNTGNAGGGIYNLGGTMNLLNTTLYGNTATSVTDGGGGIYNNGVLTVTNSSVYSNTASKNGGGIHNSATLNISNSTVSGNSAYSNDGGGIYQGGGTANLTNVTLSGNIAHYGGGITTSGGDVTLLDTTVSGNTSNYGGAIFMNGGTATFSNSTLSSNTAYQYGGGVYINTGATLYFNNATIANNYSNWDGIGGEDGGGIKEAGGTVYIQNTILANNYIWNGISLPTADDCKGTLNSADYNFIGTTSGCAFVGTTANHKTGDPKLGPLQNNGGATLTHALLPASPAIDAGNVSGCKDQIAVPLLTDQRGWHRPFGPHCDIGAYELGAFLYLPLIVK